MDIKKDRGLDQQEGERSRFILVIEDQLAHLEIIEQVLSESATACEIVAIASTQQAIAFLHRLETNPNPDLNSNLKTDPVQRPDLILMNIHLIDGQGSDILTAIKSNQSLRRIPTILLTHLGETSEILSSYRKQCNCYIIKPQALTNLGEVIRAIDSFWLNIVTLPVG
jgi:two-component system, chemotaxis family, response regulator Rcp1